MQLGQLDVVAPVALYTDMARPCVVAYGSITQQSPMHCVWICSRTPVRSQATLGHGIGPPHHNMRARHDLLQSSMQHLQVSRGLHLAVATSSSPLRASVRLLAEIAVSYV